MNVQAVPLFTPMKKPKLFDSWPPEKQEAWLENDRDRNRRYRAKHPNKDREYYERIKKENPSQILNKGKAASARYHAKNLGKIADYRASRIEDIRNVNAKYRRKNRDAIKDMSKRNTAKLVDHYVATRIGLPVKILREHLPNLLEAKRQELLLKRQLNPKPNQ